MTPREIHVASALLKYLRRATELRPVHKFNTIGKSGKGEFELGMGIDLEKADKDALPWIWDEFSRKRLIVSTATDGVDPDSWIVVTDLGRSISDTSFFQMFSDDSKPPDYRRIDEVMQIPDRSEFNKALASGIENASDDLPISLIMIDLDHFKKINDDFGHPTGDRVLKHCASTIQSAVMGKGAVYRYGGEEIVVLLPNHSNQEAAAVAERLRFSLEQSTTPGVARNITASFGVATCLSRQNSGDQLVKAADDALYVSKNTGRNRVTCANCERDDAGSTKLKAAKKNTLQLCMSCAIARYPQPGVVVLSFDVNINNNSERVLKDYRLELQTPKGFLAGDSGTIWHEVRQRQTPTHRFFRIPASGEYVSPIYQGDSAKLFSLDISFDRNGLLGEELLGQSVTAWLFIDTERLEFSTSIRELLEKGNVFKALNP